MKSFKFQRLIVLVFLVPTVSSLIISSVYSGKKKFKTYSFGSSLLPSIVKVEPNKLHLTFRNYKYLRTPQFKIEGTLPLKAPTIVRDKFRPDPNPEVVEYNFGNPEALPADNPGVYANKHVTFDDTQNNPVYVNPPIDTYPSMDTYPAAPLGVQPPTGWKPINTPNPFEFNGYSNHFPTHHRTRRFAKEYNNRFDPRIPQISQNLNGQNFGQNFESQSNIPNYSFMGQNSHSYSAPNNYQNFFNPNISPYSGNSNVGTHQSVGNNYPNIYSAPNQPSQQYNPHSYSHNSGTDMAVSSSSYSPPKYERYFNPSNQQNNKWIPIESPPVPSIAQSGGSNQKKLNIGEHYNPSASYVDEKMVEKPTYDPDEADEPDEGSVSFSISGPHGGEEVPVGYEAKIKEMHEALKEQPQHIPPGLDMSQIMKYYSAHTFTEPLKDYGYKPAFGPLGFLKSKLKSWKNILPHH